MSSRYRLSSTLSLVLTLFLSTGVASAETILDTYMELPKGRLKFLHSDSEGAPLNLDTTTRKSLIKISDVKNGFLELYNPTRLEKNKEGTMQEVSLVEAFERAQLAKFIRPNGKGFILGISFEWGDSTDGIIFLEKIKNEWLDITREVLPVVSEEMINSSARRKVPEIAGQGIQVTDSASGTYRYEMPRIGKSISVQLACCTTTETRIELLRLEFNGSKFVINER